MKRLTGKYKNGTSYYNIVPGESTIDRLAAIEDILGDDYDLDRLRELVEADRDGRFVIITRCCECKHAKENKDTVTVFCHAFMRDMRGHDFCSYGEKSTDNSTDL